MIDRCPGSLEIDGALDGIFPMNLTKPLTFYAATPPHRCGAAVDPLCLQDFSHSRPANT